MAAAALSAGGGDAIPRVGVTLAAIERFRAELAAATKGLPDAYVPGDGTTRRKPHEHALVVGQADDYICSVCDATGKRVEWHICSTRQHYVECADCFAESERLAALPPEPPLATTDDVNKLAMAHLTGARRCAYASLLDAGDASLVGEATTFVSHAWGMPFDALIAALRESEREQRAREPERTPYFWLDLLVNDQFAASSRPFEWWQTVFRENVERIGHTVVALEWERPLPLQRVWCVWEMFCAASAVTEATPAEADGAATAPTRRKPLLELALPPASRAAFVRALFQDPKMVRARLCWADLRDADAFHGGSGPGSCGRVPGGCPAARAERPCPDDKAQILGAIERAPGGVDSVTKVVTNALCDWMVASAMRSLAAEPDAGKRARSALHVFLIHFLVERGRLAEAEPLAREGAEAIRRLPPGELGEMDRIAMNWFASVLKDQGKLEEAAPVYREVLAEERRALGDGHPAALATMYTLGALLQDRGDLDGAEPLLREALAGQRRALGDEHADTLFSGSRLGALLHARGDLAGAEPLLREVLAATRRTLGNAHRHTLVDIGNLGKLLMDRGDVGGAEPLLREALAAGRHAPDDVSAAESLWCARELAGLLVSRGGTANVEEAALFANEALAGLRRKLGKGHALTLISLRMRGRVLAAQGDLPGAAAALRASLDGLRATGEDDSEARESARELAAVLRSQGDEAGAAAVEASIA